MNIIYDEYYRNYIEKVKYSTAPIHYNMLEIIINAKWAYHYYYKR